LDLCNDKSLLEVACFLNHQNNTVSGSSGGVGITLQNVPNYDEFKLLILVPKSGCSPCDKIKPLFCLLFIIFFKKFDGPMLYPISLFRLGLETCARHLSLCVGPRFFTKYFQLKKLPAGVQIHVLVQGYKGLTK